VAGRSGEAGMAFTGPSVLQPGVPDHRAASRYAGFA